MIENFTQPRYLTFSHTVVILWSNSKWASWLVAALSCLLRPRRLQLEEKIAKQHYSASQFLHQKFGSTRSGSWLYARTLHHMDRAFLKVTRGRRTLSGVLAGLPEVMVTTVGARSGQPRTLPLLCIRDEADPKTFAIIASNFGQHHNPAWYYNLKAHPRAQCSFGGRTGEYVAHEATGEEYERFWQRAVDTYIGFPLYEQRAGGRHIPIMVLAPE